MRGTFALVVVAGFGVAMGWSLLRRSADEPRPQAQRPLQDVGPVTPQPAPSPIKDAERAATDATDPAAAARAALTADLGDAVERARATDAAARLLASAESAPTRAGVEARILARRVYAAVYGCDAAPARERDAAYQRSRELFELLVRGNGAPPELVLRHKVEAGQSVWALAKGAWKQAGATAAPGFVLWLNGVSDARKLRVGQTLKIPLEPVTVLVRKRSFELTVLLGGSPVERFAVAVGADAKTPVGLFAVKDCLKNPDWYMNGKRIPYGSPEHIIGTRWIGLTGAPEADGIGIHGTTDETSIGTNASMGCVRMRNAEVERIFEWIGPGTRVEIRD